MDVKNFLKKTVLILDLNKLSLDEIIDEILHKLLDSSGSKHSFDQARSALFTHDCGKLIRCQSWWVGCISFYFPLKISLSFKWRCHHHRQNLDLWLALSSSRSVVLLSLKGSKVSSILTLLYKTIELMFCSEKPSICVRRGNLLWHMTSVLEVSAKGAPKLVSFFNS